MKKLNKKGLKRNTQQTQAKFMKQQLQDEKTQQKSLAESIQTAMQEDGYTIQDVISELKFNDVQDQQIYQALTQLGYNQQQIVSFLQPKQTSTPTVNSLFQAQDGGERAARLEKLKSFYSDEQAMFDLIGEDGKVNPGKGTYKVEYAMDDSPMPIASNLSEDEENVQRKRMLEYLANVDDATKQRINEINQVQPDSNQLDDEESDDGIAKLYLTDEEAGVKKSFTSQDVINAVQNAVVGPPQQFITDIVNEVKNTIETAQPRINLDQIQDVQRSAVFDVNQQPSNINQQQLPANQENFNLQDFFKDVIGVEDKSSEDFSDALSAIKNNVIDPIYNFGREALGFNTPGNFEVPEIKEKYKDKGRIANFYTTYIPEVKRLLEEEKSTIDPYAFVTQIGLESNWGKSSLTKKHNNFGGVKATKTDIKEGNYTVEKTKEYLTKEETKKYNTKYKQLLGRVKGVEPVENKRGELEYYYNVKAPFKTYKTPRDGLRKNLKLVTNKNYSSKGSINSQGKPEQYFNAMVKGGYATSVTYYKKLMDLYKRHKQIFEDYKRSYGESVKKLGGENMLKRAQPGTETFVGPPEFDYDSLLEDQSYLEPLELLDSFDGADFLKNLTEGLPMSEDIVMMPSLIRVDDNNSFNNNNINNIFNPAKKVQQEEVTPPDEDYIIEEEPFEDFKETIEGITDSIKIKDNLNKLKNKKQKASSRKPSSRKSNQYKPTLVDFLSNVNDRFQQQKIRREKDKLRSRTADQFDAVVNRGDRGFYDENTGVLQIDEKASNYPIYNMARYGSEMSNYSAKQKRLFNNLHKQKGGMVVEASSDIIAKLIAAGANIEMI
jgi:flagellum-specific peptidoglycan hydrolase FlgJ